MPTDATQSNAVQAVSPLAGSMWPTIDPFLFCVHHRDEYPEGTQDLGPDPNLLEGRLLGEDFTARDGFRMYHGHVVPGFPRHPHRGFETVTIVRTGLVDHSDSLGASARYGAGDVQWLTAGSGIQHAEMFPLVNATKRNPVELFQIWVNLPAADKMAAPHFKMLWSERIPNVEHRDSSGKHTRVTVVAGALQEIRPPSPPPASWGSQPHADLAIWVLHMEPHAHYLLPACQADSQRQLYFFAGSELQLGGQDMRVGHCARLSPGQPIALHNGEQPGQALLLQGRPINEPVAQRGPFVMNTQAELAKAYMDYQRTGFGGWTWPATDPVHGRERGRFARHADGRIEHPDQTSTDDR